MKSFCKMEKNGKPLLAIVFVLGAQMEAAHADNLSDLIRAMQPGTWVQANTNSYQSVWTPPEYRVGPDGYKDNVSAIIRAWSGFAWDSNRGDMILWGGGHANYPGDEVYIWHSSNLQWERGSLPTQVTPYTYGSEISYITNDNGATPQSSHTYENNVFLPTLDRFMTFGGYTFTSTSGTSFVKRDNDGNLMVTGPYLFNPNLADGSKVGGATGTGADTNTPGGNMWQNRDTYLNASGTMPSQFGSGISAVAQENGKDVVYVAAMSLNGFGNSLYKYVINDINDPTKDTWTVVGTPHQSTIFEQGSGAYDPVHNIFLRTGDNAFDYSGTILSLPFLYWDLNNPGSEKSINIIDNTGGLFPITALSSMGLEYDPVGQRFLLWGGGDLVYTLTAPASGDLSSDWILGMDDSLLGMGPGGGVANAFPDNGVLGKWHYASDLGVFVGLKDPLNGNVWVYKPTDYVNPSSVPSPSTFWLFGGALAGWRIFGRRNRHK